MKTLLLTLAGLLLVGCGEDEPKDDSDLDGDGWVSVEAGGEDCDDDDASVHPGAEEHCDAVDEDCDGEVDELPVDAQRFYLDADGDGFGDEAAPIYACEQPSGAVTEASDCDDGDASTHPGAEEVCDGADNDCDGAVDDGAVDASTWYRDADADGHGDAEHPREACEAPEGYVDSDDDCDDLDPDRAPSLEESCGDGIDNDCDGLADCEDGDCATSDSCVEACADGVDNDGDGLADCEDDECWGGEDCPLPVRSRVTGGFVQIGKHSSWSHTTSSGGSTRFTQRMASVYASGVHGQVQVLPDPTKRWSTATSWTSCRWSVSSVLFSQQSSTLTMSGSTAKGSASYGPIRAGFTVAAGCGLSTSGFLPQRLLPAGRQVLAGADSVLWYGGPVTSSFSSSFSTSSSTSGVVRSFGSASSSVWIDPMDLGSWYSVP